MLFNSYTFVIFLAAVFGLHYLPLPWKTKKLNLLAASYLFYAAWNPPFVILLLASTVIDWFAARGIHRNQRPGARKAWVALSLLGNLGMLGFFKYGGFLLDNFIALAGSFGLQFAPARFDIVLPIGISFYTFQTLSYTLDVYRGKFQPSTSFLDYALFVTFFPQLVAGPIVRASQLLPQFAQPQQATRQQFGRGLALLVLGLFQKVALADGIFAPVVDAVYGSPHGADVFSSWTAVYAFMGQIFCDFAGYSTCAIGVALCLGFRLPQNFACPLASIGFRDFWNRWHITLSTWMRDYLYSSMRPRGGATSRINLNLLLTMSVVGLWHGARWTFVVWGTIQGLLLVTERIIRKRVPPSAFWKRTSVRFFLAQLTVLVASIAAVFFRGSSFPNALSTLKALVGLDISPRALSIATVDANLALVGAAALLLTHWFMRERPGLGEMNHWPWWARSASLAAMLVLIATATGEDLAFIYFQF